MSADVNKIKKLLDKYFEINGDIAIHPDTGVVDVTGDKMSVSVRLKTIPKIKTLPVQFGRVDGNFTCEYNKLTSLQGAPTSVGGSFNCHNNQLASLQGSPTTVNGDFNCIYNQLTSLEHAPVTVGGDFYCYNNQLTSLQGAPTSVGSNFDCSSNQLTSLEHAPTNVGRGFSCYNQPTSLQGAPKSINGSYGITVYPNTLLLRLLLIQGIKKFEFVDPNGNDIYELNHLFKKYYPQGRQGILKCGLEMMSIDNGKYANNARMGPK